MSSVLHNNMSNQQAAPTPRLRTDLHRINAPHSRRSRVMIADEVTGKFARVSSRFWDALVSGTASSAAWNLAHSAGWTTARQTNPSFTSGHRWNPLFIRIPLLAMDGPASWLGKRSSFLFSSRAVQIWFTLMFVTVAVLCSKTFELANACVALPQFFRDTNPVALGCIIAMTKVAHELGHATVCRRSGASCGMTGVILMCGIPCPYCDVTDSYRLTSSKHRSAVMFAGIYVEWIIATLAAWIFMFASSQTTQLHALNVMIVCSVSTFVFNANPLMRYDGYYVLSDWLGSVSLRQESKAALGRVLRGFSLRLPGRDKALAAFYILSSIYRLVVMAAITLFLLSVFQWMQIPWLGKIVAVTVALLFSRKVIIRTKDFLIGRGVWSNVQPIKRYSLGGGMCVLLVFALLAPLPQRASVRGYLDIPEAENVHLGVSGVVQQIHCDFGNVVVAGQPLVTVRDSQTLANQIKWQREVNIASLRSRKVRENSIDSSVSSSASGHISNDPISQWKTMEVAEASAHKNLIETQKQLERAVTVAPIAGVLLPTNGPASKNEEALFSLRPRVGERSDPGDLWCRIAPNCELSAVLQVDAIHRKSLKTGTHVRIKLDSTVVDATVDSISNIQPTPESLEHDAKFDVVCAIPSRQLLGQSSTDSPQIRSLEVIPLLGQSCRGSIELPKQSIAQVALDRLETWLY